MRTLPRLVIRLALVAAPILPLAAQAPADSAKLRVSQHLLALTSVGQTLVSASASALSTQAGAHPEIPALFWTRVGARMRQDTVALIARLAEIYAAHFTQAELESLVVFYESPIGRRLVGEQPAIVQESSAVGRVWGEEIGRTVAADMIAKGEWSAPGNPKP